MGVKVSPSLPRVKSPCQEQSFFGKSKISLPRARFLWQEQNLLAKVKVSLAKATKPWGGTYFREKYMGGQGFALLAKSKVSLARAKSPCQEQGFFGKSKISLPS